MTAEGVTEFIGEQFVVMAAGLFLFFAVAEMIAPLRKNRQPIAFRWFTNLTMTALVMLVYRLFSPLIVVASSLSIEYLGIGLFNNFDPGLLPTLLLGTAILDLKQYLFHRLVHYFDWLWRVHQVHHSDLELDLTTGFRFHPLEGLLNAGVDIVVIVIFGIPVEVLALRYLLIYFANFFTHANFHLPPALDHVLRRVIVTPAMHHLHHALDRRAMNSNFGVLFSFWDRIFGTYLERHPQAGARENDTAYVYGLGDYRDPQKLNLLLLMLMPFRRAGSDAGQVPDEEPADAPGQGN